jgi:ABC-2 type transport system ATP-binding protein
MSETPAIRVRHLWHRYGNMNVLQDVSFDVARGEIFGFIGPNGAGKTTTIRAIATLLEPTAGRIEVEGLDVNVDCEEVRRRIGYMPDHAGVYERITVREYLDFFGRAYGIRDSNVVDAVIELTDLTPLVERLVATLSKGMKQRLQVARILLNDPSVLVLDEPASDLDPRARIEMRDLLLELRDLGKTILLSSHILTELSDVCTAVGILERGRLIIAGPIGAISTELARRAAQGTADVAPPPTAAGWTAPGVEETVDDAPGAGQFATGAGFAPPPVALGATPGGAPIPVSARRRLRLRVLGEAGQVAGLLVHPSILSVEPAHNGQLTVHYVGDDRFVAETVRHLVAHGVPVVAVEPERNELERIFLEATRGEVQ